MIPFPGKLLGYLAFATGFRTSQAPYYPVRDNKEASFQHSKIYEYRGIDQIQAAHTSERPSLQLSVDIEYD